MRIVVTGSVAFDYLMSFPGEFREHIVAEKADVLSVSFLVDSLKKQHGGTAANIAYTMALLGLRPEVVAAVGEDFAEYRKHLEFHGVDTKGVLVVPDEFTSSCFINTDQVSNQITAFYPGAMSSAHTLALGGLGLSKDDLVVISPNAPEAMAEYVRECQELGLRYLYDPSMQAPRLSPEDLKAGFKGAAILTGNDYEFGMMSSKLSMTEADLRATVPVCVVTHGAEGSSIFADGLEIRIPPAKPRQVVNPTGAGDSFRSGLVAGLALGLPWEVCGRLGAVAAVYAVEHLGPQQHFFTRDEFLARYRENFGDPGVVLS
ncbi:MAG: adoK [Planctomycetota bacterium]|nr:adoK [Planctomycetota bacterium]